MLIDFCILKKTSIPGINPTWSRCMSFLMCCWILFAQILLRIFVSMFIWDIGLWFSFFVLSLSGLSSSHVWIWELDYKESWALKNWCFWTVVLDKTLESPLDCKEIQPVHAKGNQSWVFIGRTDVEAETPILWPPHAKSRLIWKDPNAGKDCGQDEKGMTEDKMVGWHHRLNRHEFG